MDDKERQKQDVLDKNDDANNKDVKGIKHDKDNDLLKKKKKKKDDNYKDIHPDRDLYHGLIPAVCHWLRDRDQVRSDRPV